MVTKEAEYYIIETDLAIRPYYSSIIAFQDKFEDSGFPREIYYFKRDSLIAQKCQPGDFLLCPKTPLYAGPDYKILDPIKSLSIEEIFTLVKKDPDNYEFLTWNIPLKLVKRILNPTIHILDDFMDMEAKTTNYINPHSLEFFNSCFKHLSAQQDFLDLIIMKNKREFNGEQLLKLTRTFVKHGNEMSNIANFSFYSLMRKAMERATRFNEYMNNLYKLFEAYLENALKSEYSEINVEALKNTPWTNYGNKFKQKELNILKSAIISKKGKKYNIENIKKTSLGKKILKGLGFKTQRKWYSEEDFNKIIEFSKRLNVEFKIIGTTKKKPKRKRKEGKVKQI